MPEMDSLIDQVLMEVEESKQEAEWLDEVLAQLFEENREFLPF